MATVVSQHFRHVGIHLWFFKKFILRKNCSNFTEISRKHVFTALKVDAKKKIRTSFVKNLQFSTLELYFA